MLPSVRDTEIVALLVAGDRRGLEAAYDAYADRLHDYARGLLRSIGPDAAADVTHDTFLIAFGKAADLRDPERLRPWLYAITRNECLRLLRQAKRTRPVAAEQLTDLTDETAGRSSAVPDPSSALATADVAELVRAAADGLAPKDREVFDLGLRHDLSGPAIAAALGVSDNAAHAMVSRVRTALSRALGALLVTRHRECEELDRVLQGWDGDFDALWRKRIARHVDGCLTCTSVQDRELSPAALLAVAPLAAAPLALRGRLVSASFDDDQVAEAVRRAAPYRPDGFPGATPAARRRGLLGVAAALVLLIGGFGGAAVLTRDADRVDRAAAGVGVSPPASASGAAVPAQSLAPIPTLRPGPTRIPEAPPGTPVESPPLSTAPSPTPTVAPTPTASPTGTPTPTLAPTLEPTRTPSPTESTPAPEPTVTVTPDSLTVPPGGSGRVVVTAVGGAVRWTAVSSSALVSLGSTGGSLAEDSSVVVPVRVSPNARPGTQVLLTFQPGGATVAVVIG